MDERALALEIAALLHAARANGLTPTAIERSPGNIVKVLVKETSPPMPRETRKRASRPMDEGLRQFLDECTIIDPLARIQSTTLYRAYVDWCGSSGFHPLAHATVGWMLKSIRHPCVKGNRIWYLNRKLLPHVSAADAPDPPADNEGSLPLLPNGRSVGSGMGSIVG